MKRIILGLLLSFLLPSLALASGIPFFTITPDVAPPYFVASGGAVTIKSDGAEQTSTGNLIVSNGNSLSIPYTVTNTSGVPLSLFMITASIEGVPGVEIDEVNSGCSQITELSPTAPNNQCLLVVKYTPSLNLVGTVSITPKFCAVNGVFCSKPLESAAVAVRLPNRAYMPSVSDNSVTVVDAFDMTVLATVDMAGVVDMPISAVVSRDGNHVYILGDNSTLGRMDPATYATETLNLGNVLLRDLHESADGSKLFISAVDQNTDIPQIIIVDASRFSVQSVIPAPAPVSPGTVSTFQLAVSSDDRLAYQVITNENLVYIYDLFLGTVTSQALPSGSILTTSFATAVVLNSQNTRWYVNNNSLSSQSIDEYDVATNSLLRSIQISGISAPQLYSMILSDDDRYLYVVDQANQRVVIIDLQLETVSDLSLIGLGTTMAIDNEEQRLYLLSDTSVELFVFDLTNPVSPIPVVSDPSVVLPASSPVSLSPLFLGRVKL